MSVTIEPQTRNRALRRIAAKFKPPFRGGIPENCARFKFIGKAYEAMPPEQLGHFQLRSARHVAGPMAALVDPWVRLVHIIGATQVLKSVVGDAWVIYCMEHVCRWMLVLFEGDEKATQYAGTRLMPTLHQHPQLGSVIRQVQLENRFDVTTTLIKAPGMVLKVGGLNDKNVSTFSWPLIWVSEAWQHHNDGLLEKAFKRADRFPEDSKILNESQAGLADEDLHNAVKKARPVPLEWQCPACAGWQTWEWRHWSYIRPADFVPRPRRKVSTANVGGQIALIESEIPKAGTYGGMKWVDDARGTRTIEERSRSAWWECVWCGHKIEDTKPVRQGLMDSYRQDYRSAAVSETSRSAAPDPAGTGALHSGTPRQVVFTLPYESARDNRFEKTVANYLAAREAKAQGNPIRMQDWFMAERAVFYDPALGRILRVQTQEKYDAKSDWPEEWAGHRTLVVDCQHELQFFWASVWAVSRTGKSRQLWRGMLRGFGDHKKEDKEQPETITAKQREFGVKDQFVFLDCGYMRNELATECVRHGHWATINRERHWVCWTLLCGSKQRDFSHADDKNSKVRYPVSDPFLEYPELRVDQYRVSVEVYYFSALQMGDMWARYRDGHGPETMFLAETESIENPLSWTAQINACTKQTKQNPKNGEIVELWLPPKQTTPHHYFDIGRMFMAIHCLWGIAGQHQGGSATGVPEVELEAVEVGG